MYLTASRTTGNYGFESPETKQAFKQVLDAIGLEAEDVAPDSPTLGVEVTVCYWRKANAIHKWFVENVQDGRDECQRSYVERDQLKRLLAEVKKVLKHKDKAPELMPTTSGFFFGSTAYDEWYWEDMKKTQDTLERVLKNPRFQAKGLDGWTFYYQASW
jgi:hypothetical protein